MNDYAATSTAYALAASALWLRTRRSSIQAIRLCWKGPHWILARLLLLFVLLHVLFDLLGIGTAQGFLVLGVVVVVGLVGDYIGGSWMVLAVLGLALQEWLFWFPSRDRFILRGPAPGTATKSDQLLGLEGFATSDLKPAGIVRVRDVDYAARADFGLIAKGEPVRVSSVDTFELTVTRTNGQPVDPANGSPPSRGFE